LINEMGDEKDWQLHKQVAESLIRINKLEQDQNYAEAITELNQAKLPAFNYIDDFIVLKKAALLEKAGNVKAAYDSVAIKFAKLPTDKLDTALELYGKKTGKNKGQVMKDIQTIRDNAAVPAYPFDLGLYTSNGRLNLIDLKGKVVLLTFWFPGCGPCREEFPHFQAVINDFKGDNVVYVGINVDPQQDPYVLPFMKNSKYSFIPLHGTSEFAAKYYGVQGEPVNFLIDKDGKIIFRDFRIDNTNHRTLELMIASLLQKGQQNN
jgi:thiol-disulfide isomerase/thioredoxin